MKGKKLIDDLGVKKPNKGSHTKTKIKTVYAEKSLKKKKISGDSNKVQWQDDWDNWFPWEG